jgi:quercetin dioxygenase-like cupin family protein
MGMSMKAFVLVGLVFAAVLVPSAARDRDGSALAHEADKTLLDNDQVLVMEIVFPAGFKGEEHEAPVNEFAYVLDGEFAVVTKGKGKTVVKKGQVEYAPKGTVHYSVNETRRPARVLVVLLKER